MKIESTTDIERWEQFRNMSVKVVSVVASEFPHPVELDQVELIGSQPVGKSERFVCTETLRLRRELRAKLVSNLVKEVGSMSLRCLRNDAQASDNPPASWVADFHLAVDLAAAEITADPHFEMRLLLNQVKREASGTVEVDQADFDPLTYLTLRQLVCRSESLDDRLKLAVIEAICSLLGGARAPVPTDHLDELAEYLLKGEVNKDLRQWTEEATHWPSDATYWLTGPDTLMASSQAALEILLTIIQSSFDEACRDLPLHDWSRVEALRKGHLEREHNCETLAGTISYLVDAGILLKKPADDVVRYTLSPAMVAPLMASTASGSGDSGFKLLSKLRTATTPAFKELAKEAAQIVFTSATIGFGKLAMGG